MNPGPLFYNSRTFPEPMPFPGLPRVCTNADHCTGSSTHLANHSVLLTAIKTVSRLQSQLRHGSDLRGIPGIPFTLGPDQIQRLQLSRHILSSRASAMLWSYCHICCHTQTPLDASCNVHEAQVLCHTSIYIRRCVCVCVRLSACNS